MRWCCVAVGEVMGLYRCCMCCGFVLSDYAIRVRILWWSAVGELTNYEIVGVVVWRRRDGGAECGVWLGG